MPFHSFENNLSTVFFRALEPFLRANYCSQPAPGKRKATPRDGISNFPAATDKKEKGHPSTAKMDSFFAFPLCLLPVSSGSRVKGGKQCEGCVNPLVAGESFTQLLRHNFALRSQ